MKKFLGSLFILGLALLVFVVIAKDWILKTAIEQGVTRITGFSTKVDSLKFTLPSTIHIQGLNIHNPSSFKEKTFVNIPEIYVSVVLGEILKGTRIHLPEVRFNIQEVNIEKNEKGVSNVELLSSIGGGGAAKQNVPPTEKKEQKQLAMPFLLEKLVLTIRNVSYEDHSGLIAQAPLPGKKLAMDLNVQGEVFTNITDPNALVRLILAKVLSGATLGRLLNIDPQQLLTENFGNVVGSGKALIGQSATLVTQELGQVTNLVGDSAVTKKAGALLEGSGNKAKDVLGGATSATKDQVSGLLGKIKSPLAEKTEKVQ